MWMTREQVAAALGIVVNSVRGKVQRGQIERKTINGKNLYRIVSPEIAAKAKTKDEPEVEHPKTEEAAPVQKVDKPKKRQLGAFDPKQVLLDELDSLKLHRGIDAIEKGDEIDLATGEISRDLEAKLSMRQQKQLKDIQEALDRLKHGDYGLCEDCGESIPEQRLRLFPAAKLCVRCQEEADRHDKLRRDVIMRGGTWRDDSSDGTYGKSFDD
jgi:DnaK suppressor protein